MFLTHKQSGQSLVEVIIALAIFSLVASALVTMVVGSLNVMSQGGDHIEADALAQEGIEAVRAIKDTAWNKNTYSQSAVGVDGNSWVFSGEGTSEQIGKFTREIEFYDVCRDENGDIANCPGVYNDVHSKKVVVIVSWQTNFGIMNSVEKITYITNWDTKEWIKDSMADFENGSFYHTATSTLGSGDGSVILGEN